ncbi:MAG TPA: lipoprotein [Steroidobacteraceae bacterium]|nr:lipoprotein [Steroidobacteraceae bacterium]
MRLQPLTRPCNLALAALCFALLAGCGQKGPLVRPSTRAAAPVVIHAPGDAATAPADPGAAPAASAVTPAQKPDDDPNAPPRP